MPKRTHPIHPCPAPPGAPPRPRPTGPRLWPVLPPQDQMRLAQHLARLLWRLHPAEGEARRADLVP